MFHVCNTRCIQKVSTVRLLQNFKNCFSKNFIFSNSAYLKLYFSIIANIIEALIIAGIRFCISSSQNMSHCSLHLPGHYHPQNARQPRTSSGVGRVKITWYHVRDVGLQGLVQLFQSKWGDEVSSLSSRVWPSAIVSKRIPTSHAFCFE